MNTGQEWNKETQQQYNKIKQEYDYYQNSIFNYKEYCIECKSQNKKPLHPSELIQKRNELWSDYYSFIILKRKTNQENDNKTSNLDTWL